MVPRRFIRVLSDGEPREFKEGSGRKELAEAIASRKNPLTARVMVNRVWGMLMGRPLVGTPSNFGHSGDLPTNQELIDDLPARSIGDLRGVLWHRCADSGSLEGEPFVSLKHKVPFRTFYDVKQLPAAYVACAYSGLDDDSSEQSYNAIRKWMNVRGYQLAGPKREIYLDQMLEIQFPLKSA